MDLREYYQKIRETEQKLTGSSVVVVSTQTPDGGKEGVRTEVPKHIAAKMLVEGRARLASDVEAREFAEQKLEAKQLADEIAAASRMQVTVVASNELRNPTRSKE